MRSVMMGIGLAASLTLGLPAMATPPTDDTGTSSGSDDGTTDGGTTDGGTTDGGTTDGGTTDGGTADDSGMSSIEDTSAYIEGDGAADLAGEKGGCQSVVGTGSAGFLLLLGAGALRRRRR